MTKSKFQIFRSKYILYALIAILIMLIIGVGTSLYAKNKIKDQLQRIDNLTYKDLNVNFFLGNVELNEINYSWLKEKEDTSRITIRTVDLGGISFWKLLKENKLIIDQLSISGSECQILELPKFEINDTSRTASKDEFKDITIKKLKLQNSSIDYTDSVGWHLTIANADIELDSISYSNDSLNYKDLVCSIYKINHVTKNGLHDFSLSKVKANSLDGSIQLDSLSIFPKHSWASWKNHVPWKKARLHFDAPKIEIAGVNFDNLIDNPSFVSELLVVNDAHLRVQVDEDIDVCNSCYKAFVHEKLLKANLPINIEKAEVKNSSIYVEAYDKSDQRLIDVEFDNLYASIYNVTNIDTIIASNPKIIADVQTLFAKQSQLKTQIQFALNDPNYGYVIDAELGAIDLLDFNKKIQKGAKISVESGRVNALNFHIDGNNELATGTMNLNYEDLKVNILNNEKTNRKTIYTGVVNLGVKNGSGEFEEGKIYYERKEGRTIFHQWWGAIESGFKSVVLRDVLLKKELW